MSELTCNAAIAFEYPKEAIISYAQVHEDVLLWRCLHSVTPGFYVDIGAHDPTHLSVTRAFYERGWHGINIEPNPKYAQKIRDERPRDQTVGVALGAGDGHATIYDFGATGLSTMVHDIAADHLAAGLIATELQVPVTTLAAVLDDLDSQEIHFLKIDVEGYERQVLTGADFKRFRPWIVLVEAVRPTTSIPSFGAWEPLLLEAGYQFAYFDGLNHFYVSDEHAELKRFFSVPVNINDPYRDYQTVSLTAMIEKLAHEKKKLEHDKMRHDVPRLGAVASACDAGDAAGLLQIVETQAADLVWLRRALAARESAIAEIRGANLSSQEVRIFDWVGSLALAELIRTRAGVTEQIEQSWLRVGQFLGLAKRLDWTTEHWKPEFVAAHVAGETPVAPSVAELVFELNRINGLLDDFRKCPWLGLGRRLGLAKPLAEKSVLLGDPVLLQSFPYQAAQYLANRKGSKTPLSDHERLVEHTNQYFLEQCREFAIDTIFDIGANTGQFVQALRDQGYHDHIVSFEPLSDAHETLVMAAQSDPLWDVAERCALGARDGWAEVNISANSYSSSLLPMLDAHRNAAPHSTYVGKESCRVITLDSYIERTFSDPSTLFAAKIDTQGYEAEVLAGLRHNHNRVKVILCEISVAPLYAGGPSVSELCQLLAEFNYRCVALSPEFEEPRTGELLQMNGVFVKRE